jgi:hypothetical protein
MLSSARQECRRLALCAILGLLAATTAGCNYLESDDDSPTDPSIIILIGGRCRAFAATIECVDESTSEPPQRLESVDWELRSATTGRTLDSKPGEPGDEVIFSGLRRDTYNVIQKVLARDGRARQKTHEDLEID